MCVSLFSCTDWAAHGDGARGVPQYTQEDGHVSAGPHWHRRREETCKYTLLTLFLAKLSELLDQILTYLWFTVPVKSFDTPTHSRVFLFLNSEDIKTMKYTMNHIVTQINVKNLNIFYILQSSHPFPWWQLCTLLAFSQPASPGMLFQHSWRSSHICWAPVGCFSFTPRFNTSQTISIGLRSGDFGGQVIWCSTPSLSFLVK